jgi:hypothetical protein
MFTGLARVAHGWRVVRSMFDRSDSQVAAAGGFQVNESFRDPGTPPARLGTVVVLQPSDVHLVLSGNAGMGPFPSAAHHTSTHVPVAATAPRF